MSKRKLISLVLALMLALTLAIGLISCNRTVEKLPNDDGSITDDGGNQTGGSSDGTAPDEDYWISCQHTYDNACDGDCNICGEKRRPEDHAYDNNCDSDCNECGYVRVPSDHVYDDDSDTECNECGHVRPGESECQHVYDNVCDATCNICGRVREVEHVYDNACDTDCNVCGEVRQTEHVYDNEYDAECNNCGHIREIDACIHEYDNDCDTDCNKCGEIRVTSHKEQTIPGKAATCLEDGLTDGKICSVCQTITVEQTVIPATGHTLVQVTGTPATCTESGMTDGVKCLNCDYVQTEQTVIGPLGHLWSDDEYLRDETHHWKACLRECGAIDGYEEHTFDENDRCTVCHYVFNCSHEKTTWETVREASCKETGRRILVCDLCGEVVDEEILPQLAHTPNIDVSEVDCGHPQICEVCGTVLKEGPAHRPSGNSCTQPVVCLVCGTVINETPRGHIYNTQVSACESDIRCTACGEIVIAKTGHNYGSVCGTKCTNENCNQTRVVDKSEHTIVVLPGKAATCTEAGLTNGEKCSVCQEIITVQVAIPATGHRYELCGQNCINCGEAGTGSDHVYDNDCDATCNNCEYVRSVSGHIYANNCDKDCEICGAVRDDAPHVVAGDCDTVCNECGEAVTPTAKHTFACLDNECSVCGYERPASEVGHKYTNACDATCDVCGDKREVTHNYDTEAWESDATSHWNPCTTEGCNARGNVAGHEFSNACDAYCNACEYERTPAEHIYDNACDKDCNTCGGIRETTHIGDVYHFDTTYHWTVCTECGERTSVNEVHAYGEDGSCTVCTWKPSGECTHGAAAACDTVCPSCHQAIIPSADHKYEVVSVSDGHYKQCTVCEKIINEQAHTFVVLPDPTDTNKHHSACVVCGYVNNDIEKKPHTFVGSSNICAECGYETDCAHTEGEAADCVHATVCATCGCYYGTVEPHNPKTISEQIDATCTTEGTTAIIICADCNTVIQGATTIPVKGHNLTSVSGTPADCENTGLTAGEKCSECDYTTQTVIPALGHINKSVEYVAATCEKGGYIKYVCERCTASSQTILEALGHEVSDTWTVVKAPTCEEQGEQAKYCTRCNTVRETSTLEPTGHLETTDVVIAPTHTTQGYTNVVCNTCKKIIATKDIVDPVAHTWSAWTTDREASCTADGLRSQTCSCGAQRVETIPAIGGHTWDEETLGYNAFKHWQVCSVCGEASTSLTDHIWENGVCECGYACTHVWTQATCLVPATCSVCGVASGNKAEHTYVYVDCTSDGSCRVCGTPTSPKGHTPVEDAAVEATCDRKGLTKGSHCSVCGEVIVAQKTVNPKGHSFGADDVCTICGTAKPVGAVTCEHYYDDCEDTTCNKCGESRTAPGHVLKILAGKAPTCTEDGLTIGYQCVSCDKITTEQTVIPSQGCSVRHYKVDATCTEDGSEYDICDKCGTKTNENSIPAKGHDFVVIDVASTCTKLGYTTETCTRCGNTKGIVDKTEYAAHTPGEWIVESSASCTAEGSKYQICAVCMEKIGESVEIPMTGHNETVKITPATCTTDKVTTYTCTVCGNERTVTDEGSSTGHTEGGYVVVSQSTCSTTGTRYMSCKTCGAMMGEIEIVPRKPHNYVASITKEPTCYETGEKTWQCTACPDFYIDETPVPMVAHTPGVWVIDFDATCEVAGSKSITCTVLGCNAVIAEEEIPATGHNYVGRIDGGYVVYTCTNCSDSYSEEYEEEAHICAASGSYRVTTKPTCTLSGEKYAVCICGADVGEAITIPATGHSTYTVEKSATCQTPGYRKEICSVCGETVSTRTLDLTSCVAGGWIVTSATCELEGNKYQVCLYCGREISGTEVSIPAIGHSYIYVVTAPTCSDAGYTTVSCASCNYTEITNNTAALEHTSGGWQITKPATCLEAGTKDEICALCGTIMTADQPINPIGHNTVSVITPATCTEHGYKTTTCVNCGDVTVDQTAQANGHTESAWITDTLATCQAGGVEHTVCTVCGERVSSRDTNALNHNYEVIAVVPSSCVTKTQGYTVRMCTLCTDIQNSDFTEYQHTWESEDDTACDVCGFVRNTESECEHVYSYDCDATCNICGAVREASHNIDIIPAQSATCTSTGLTEGKRCTICGQIIESQKVTPMTAHTYDNACDADCNVCGATRTPSAHKYDNACDTDCNVCGAIRTIEHTYDNACDAVCNVCGATRIPSDHVYSNACDADCNVCGATRVPSAHVYDNCYDTECNECGHTRPVTHNFGDDNVCDDCGYTVSCAHSYDDCTDTTCNKCGEVREAPGHTVGTAATCTAAAKCAVCKKSFGDPAGHRPNIPAPTCTQNQICTVCNRTLAQRTGHTYTHTVTAPTCTEQGYTTHTCSNCGDTYKDTYTDAKGHTLITLGAVAATCQKTGLTEGKKCSVCGTVTVEQTVIDKTPHNYGSDNKCTVCGTEKAVCQHQYDNDCDAVCNLCNEQRVVEGHNYVSGQYETTATTHWQICTKCGTTTGRESHKYSSATCDPDCDVCGYVRTPEHRFSTRYTTDAERHWYACQFCSETKSSELHSYSSSCDETCDVCSYKRSVTHTWSGAYTSDGNYHWYVCTKGCGATTTKQPHVWQYACSSVCSTCGYERATDHTLGDTWYSNSEGHYKLCTSCGDKGTVEAHVYDNACDTNCNKCGYTRTTEHVYDADRPLCDDTCNVCGYTRTVPHNYSTFWSKDGTNHWHECSGCGVKKDVTAHVYTNACDSDCNSCGYIRSGASHSWSSGWTSGANGHYHICSKCNGTSTPEAHVYDHDCDKNCNACGYTRATSHRFATTYTYNDNQHWQVCQVEGCGATQNTAAHVFSNGCDTTCNTTGCAYTRATSHVYGSTWNNNAVGHWKNCTNCGVEAYYGQHAYSNECDTYCETCGRTRAVPHVFDNDCDTTCNTEGCGYTRTANHSFSTAYDSDATTHWQSCSVCGERRNEEAHSYGSDNVCDDCGYNKSVTHNYSSTLTWNDTHHYYKCTDPGCDSVSGKQTHKYDNNCDTTCNVEGCGYTRTVTHTTSSVWAKDSTGHWKNCLICGVKATSTSAHVYGGGTCDANCDECGYVRVVTHTYDNDTCDADCNNCGYIRSVPHDYPDYSTAAGYNKDSSKHWVECASCGTQKLSGAHVYDNNCDAYCNTCNYNREPNHNFSTLWTTDADYHYHLCTVCKTRDTETQAKHVYDAACDSTCNECGYTRATTGHNYTYVNTDPTAHYEICACGLTRNRGVHVYDSTCDSECNTCGYKRTGADHVYSTTYTKGTTTHWYACTNCGAKSQEVPHAYDNNCDTDCNDCGYTRSPQHNYNKAYNTTHHYDECGTCHDIKNKVSHTWTSSCDSMCDDCGYGRDTSHTYSQTRSYNDTEHWYQCIICGTRNESSVAGHDYTNSCDKTCNDCAYTRSITHTYIEDTCKYTTCTVCGDVRAVTHTYESGVYKTDESYHWQECTVCGNRRGSARHSYTSSATICDACGYERELGACEHVYDNDCYDATCNKCGATRTDFQPHQYTYSCDSNCKNCGQRTKDSEHVYEYNCSSVCTICKQTTRSASHYYSKYDSDSGNHWKICEYCKAVQSGSTAAHIYGATCDADCNTCGYIRNTTHSFNTSKYESNDLQHWYVCSGCGAAGTKTNHVFDNNCDTDCNICGKTRNIAHSYGKDWVTSTTNHWKECSVCFVKKDNTTHTLKLESKNATEHHTYCTVCGYVASTQSHDFSSSTTCPCGYVKQVIVAYKTSVDYINTDGPYSGFGSDSVNGVLVLKGHNTDWSGKLSITGWCVSESAINGYYYTLDGGRNWIAITQTVLSDATSAHISAASSVVPNAQTANSVFGAGLNTPGLTVDLSAYKGQTLDITFAASTAAGVYVKIVTIEDVTVYIPGTDTTRPVVWDKMGTDVKGVAIDSLKYNGSVWKISSNEGGSATGAYVSYHRSMTIKSGAYVTLSGWCGLMSQGINSFGYFFAESPAQVTLSTSFVGTAESGVISEGGAYAKRYVIDVDTTGLSEGVHRIYFVAQASNGTIYVIQYVDLWITGPDDDYSGSDPSDSAISLAQKDTNSSFSTAPVTVSGTSYTMYAGLKFTTSASYNSSNYRFTATSSGITLNFPEGQFGTFNRFKVQYSASTATKAVMTYVDISGNVLTDTFYLEAGQGTFTCLVKDYLDGAYAQEIQSITFYSLGASSNSFMLAGLTTEDYTIYDSNMIYIQNAKFKVGTRLSWGGALCYFEDKTYGVEGVRNLINIYDVGRLVQQSWYGTVITGNYNGTAWKYNPVQGGDWRNNESRIIDVVAEDYSIYIKAQPLEWGMDSTATISKISPSYMENWYTLYSDRLQVNNRFVDYSGYRNTSVNQEIPAFYFIGYLNSFVYESTTNWSNTPSLVQKDDLPFWSGGSGPDNDYSTNYNTLTRFNKSGHQTTWGAWINKSTGKGIGFYVPGIQRLISGRNQHNLWGDTMSPFSPGCSYTATGVDNTLVSYRAYSYSYLMTSGTPSQIRNIFKTYYSTVSKDF